MYQIELVYNMYNVDKANILFFRNFGRLAFKVLFDEVSKREFYGILIMFLSFVYLY